MVQASDGTLYGTTRFGGSNGGGTVFKITPAGQYQTVYNFGGKIHDVVEPAGALAIGADGNIYGGAEVGGQTGSGGGIFKVTPAGVESVLYSFETHPNDAYRPTAGVTYNPADDCLYGVTYYGGGNNQGAAFKVTMAGVETVIKSFSTTVGNPNSPLCYNPADGQLYGTADLLNNTSTGQIFKLSTSGALSIVKNLSNDTGTLPNKNGITLGADGNLYGALYQGGYGNTGTIYKISKGVFSKIYEFQPSDGYNPNGGVIYGSDGALYGTTENGGTNGWGTLFKLTLGGSPSFTTLYNFTGSGDGKTPGALMQASNGLIYGAARAGGLADFGSIFNITTTGSFFTVKDLNTGFHDGNEPTGHLLLGRDGNWYGTTASGGIYEDGTLYRILADGTYQLLHMFSRDDPAGYFPSEGLVQAADGTFYGACIFGASADDRGSIFKFKIFENSTSPSVLPLYIFDTVHGATPNAPPIVGMDGNLYGMAQTGGSNFKGVIYRLTTSGVITVLRNFVGSNGQNPGSRLVQGPDGGLYGMTNSGGFGEGVAFKIMPSGAGVWVTPFTAAQHYQPYQPLVFGADGNLYGTSTFGCGGNKGGIFKVTPTGVATTVVSFDGSPLLNPQADLLLAPDNKLYSVDIYGNVFRFDGTNTEVLGTLDESILFDVFDGLVNGPDGGLYGVSPYGGTNRGGTVYKLDVGIPGISTLVVSAPTTATAGAPFNVTVTAQDQFGNTFPGYTGTVHFTSNDPNAVLPADVTLTNGVGTFSTTLKLGAYITLRARDTATSSITGTTHVTVTSDVANHLTISAPSTVTAGNGYYVVVSAKDQYENVVKGYTGTIHFTSTDPLAVLPADLVLTGGAKQLPVKLKTRGTQTITVTDTADAGLTVTTGTITVN